MSRDPPDVSNDNAAPDLSAILASIEDGMDPFVTAVRELARCQPGGAINARTFKRAFRSADPVRADLGARGLVMLVRLLFLEEGAELSDADVLAATCLRDPDFVRVRALGESAPHRGGRP